MATTLVVTDKAVLAIAPKTKIYLHPAATESKFSRKPSGAKSIGMPDPAKKAIGGMHLLNAKQVRIDHTIEVFNKYEIQKIVPLHCTGRKAMGKLKNVFGDKCLFLGTGGQINFYRPGVKEI